MIIASAQTKPKRGDIYANLLDHYRLIEIASNNGATLIVFPEMSITGYEQENAETLSFSPNDARIDKLIDLSANKNMTIIAGAPIKMKDDLFIGEFIIQPDRTVQIYTKQFLHPGEEVFFKSSFNYNPTLLLGDERISMAICADIDHPQHPDNACKMACSMYISSLFFSPKGIPNAHQSLSTYAKNHKMHVLMSNFCGESWGQPSGGRSAFWDNTGKLVAEMNDSDSGMVLVEKYGSNWIGKLIKNQ